MATAATTTAPTMPHNVEAERALIAAGILDNDKIPVVSEHVAPEDFFVSQNRVIYLATTALAGSGKPVDLVTLTDYLQQSGDLERAGGIGYVASVTDGQMRAANIRTYADIVRESARRRKLIHLCDALQRSAFAGDETAQQLLETGTQEFLALMSKDGSASMPHTWDESVMSAMEEIVGAIRNPQAVMRLNCGVRPLDDKLGGLRRELVLGVGMTSHGKSLLAMQFAINGDTQGYRGLILSAEMTKEALASRELAHASEVPLYLLRRPELIRSPDTVINSLTEAALKERGRKLLVVDRDIKPARVWSLCELVAKRGGLDFVIVDYDQLVIRAGLGRRDDEFRAQAEFMAEALAIQKRLNVCFMLLCQPRKVDEDVARGRRPPRIEQIFGSSAAGNTAHVVWWIMREFFIHGMDTAYESKAKAFILKARNDFTGHVSFGFDKEKVLFVSDAPWDPESDVPQDEESQATKRRKAKKGEDE